VSFLCYRKKQVGILKMIFNEVVRW